MSAFSTEHDAGATTLPSSEAFNSLFGRRAAGFASARRGSIVRRALVAADVMGLTLAFVVSTLLFIDPDPSDIVAPRLEVVLFLLTLPLWIALAHMHGLYHRDEERADHATTDEVFRVVQLVTLGTWVVFVSAWMTHVIQPQLVRLVSFWTLAIVAVAIGRAIARAWCRTRPSYVQTALIVGAGNVGQLIARKIEQHPEFGIRLIGFVDDDPKAARPDLGDLNLLGTIDDLHEVVLENEVDRVMVAFSKDPDARTMSVVRDLRDREITIDVVPRLFELVGPRADMHSIEGLPLLCLPPARLSHTSRIIKRLLDVVGASVLLLLTAPLFAYVAVRIKLDSRGPVLFRQTRLGINMQPFTTLKFRTMHVGTDESEHREYIRSIMTADAAMKDGKYKLERRDSVTHFGRWLRKTSLDELPQLLNILAGDMSLVGPRPCIPYEAENFQPHQFERFLVPQGLTGLWQVTARAKSTFGEALDMDVAYVRGWSLGLDLRLIFRTPFALLRQRRATT
jgi:exopolysaccharide biosynthesis polyprenyl glycosylphosphotransferase